MTKRSAQRIRPKWLAIIVGLLAIAGMVLVAPGAADAESTTPGMCNGRSDGNVRLNAQAWGAIDLRLNVVTDPAGRPAGLFDVGQGPSRIRVDKLCRLWQHVPGQSPEGRGEEDDPEGATNVHVVGTGRLPDGTAVLVRADVRALAARDGRLGSYGKTEFRVRYRPLGSHDHEEFAAEEEEEGWVRIPAEGWAPLNRFNLQVFAPLGAGVPGTTSVGVTSLKVVSPQP